MSGNIVEASELKKLQGMLEKAKADKKSAQIELREAKEKLLIADERIISLNKRLKPLIENKELCLSEHAIIRYLERVELIPVSEIKNRVITEELKTMYRVLGDGTFPIMGTHSAVIKNNTIITIA